MSSLCHRRHCTWKTIIDYREAEDEVVEGDVKIEIFIVEMALASLKAWSCIKGCEVSNLQ